MTGGGSSGQDRVHTMLTAVDGELHTTWKAVPEPMQEWLVARRSLLIAGMAAATALLAGPMWLPFVAATAYTVQPIPRRVRSVAVPFAMGVVLSVWIGSIFGGLGLASVDTHAVTLTTSLSIAMMAAVAAAERRLRGTLSLRWPQTQGLGDAILLGTRQGAWVTAAPQVAALVIGPPRSGKTTGVVIPNVMAWDGPVLTTSTRHDVIEACAGTRLRHGAVWCFEPLAPDHTLPAGVHRLHWSPLRGCMTWDIALERARALLAGASKGAENADHWRARGGQLLGALLHAAAVGGVPMSTVCEWVHANRLEPAQHALRNGSTPGPQHVLDGIAATPDRERGSIWSAVAGALIAFDAAAVLASADSAREEDFDTGAWLDGDNAIFVIAGADQSVSVAPLVVGLVEEVRSAALRRSDRDGPLARPLLLALDEVANISPLPTLPQIASEGGGRNIVLLAAVQDLAQVRERWSADVADGLLTLAGAKLVLPGLGDANTLDRLEKLSGKEWVTHDSTTWSSPLSSHGGSSTHRTLVEEPVHAAAAIRTLRRGTALAIVGARPPVVVDLAFHNTVQPFRDWGTRRI